MDAQPAVGRHRMIGSTAALVVGVLGLLGALGRVANEQDASVAQWTFVILGAVAYRSRRRRLLGLRADSHARVLFEIACLVMLTVAWLALVDLAVLIVEEPVRHFVFPIWALVAYPCATLRLRPKNGNPPTVILGSFAAGVAALALAVVVGGAAAHALREGQPGVQPASEPPRPAQGVLDAVRPLGLAVSMGQPFEVPSGDGNEPEWLVPVECGLADGEGRRLDDPTPAERWLFGTLWGDSTPPPPRPRSYIQPIPKLTLSRSSVPAGDVAEAAWAVFMRCPLSTERLLLPLWPEDAAELLDGSAEALIRVEALGMSHQDPRVPDLDAAGSADEAFIAALPMALAIARGDLSAFVAVDGLVNGGPVFEVRDFVLDPDLSRVPSSVDPIRR